MAYNGRATPPPRGQSPFPDHRNPRRQFSMDDSHVDPQRTRPRERSGVRGDGRLPDSARGVPPKLSMNEAVSNTFDKADAANMVPPDLIAQITQNVIQQLKSSGIADGQSFTPPPPPPPPVQQPIPQSPSTHSGSSPTMPTRNVYTPPSPDKHPDYPSYGSPQPQPIVPPTTLQSTRDREPSVTASNEYRAPSPMSQSSETGSAYVRPKGPLRLSTAKEETTLEKIWGQLFDEEGHPTVRLGTFLRGIATHIIEDYEPRMSLVVTPDKMVKFMKDVKLPNEIYPWSIVFDDERSSISRMYRDLECQHHLVQERHDEKPDIPGLTPIGFQRWATLLIQAHPNEEFERLGKVVLNMPICNPEDRKERFPKEISRRLFPGYDDPSVGHRLRKAMEIHANVEIPKPAKEETPQPPRPEVHQEEPPQVPSAIERERKPYSTIPTESAIDDTNPIPSTTQPIERERKPYTANPGGGKSHEEDARAREAVKPGRSNSTATGGRTRPIPIGSSASRPVDPSIPEHAQHHRAPSNVRRHRSPSFSTGQNDLRRSDTDIRGYPSSYQAGPLPTAESLDEDPRRYAQAEHKRNERARRQAEDDARIFGGSPSSRRYDPRAEGPSSTARAAPYLNDEDYYRGEGRSAGNGYDYYR